MSTESIAFHLLPIAERLSLHVLSRREQTYLSGSSSPRPTTPLPHPDLNLVIVVPAFNEEDTIGTLLQCLVAQDLPTERMEVVVINNNSSDGTADAVLKFARSSPVSIHIITEQMKGCVRAVRTGMDAACARLGQVCPPDQGLIATIDADDQVGPRWAGGLVSAIVDGRADMVRGPTQIVPPLSAQVEEVAKVLCDVENRVNGFAELARLRVDEALRGDAIHSYPRWMARITGPNFAISRAAYIAVGGLDPRPPGDQASHLANPLLRLGGAVVQSRDPTLTLFRSTRGSLRNFDEAGGFGVGFGIGFGDMLARARIWAGLAKAGDYPNPAWLESGLNRLLADLDSRDAVTQRAAREFAAQFVDFPCDPSSLYNYGAPHASPLLVPLPAAPALLVGMTRRAGGIDYRASERFLVAREHLRQEVLGYVGPCVHSGSIVDGALVRMGFDATDLPAHVAKAAAALRALPTAHKAGWFDRACRVLEEIYAQTQID